MCTVNEKKCVSIIQTYIKYHWSSTVKNIAVRERAAIDLIDFEPWLLKSAGWVKPCPSSLLASPPCLHFCKLCSSAKQTHLKRILLFSLDKDNSWLFLSNFPLCCYCALPDSICKDLESSETPCFSSPFAIWTNRTAPAGEPAVPARPVRCPSRAPGQGKGCAAAAPEPCSCTWGLLGCTAGTTWSAHFALTLEKAPEQNQQQFSSSHVTTSTCGQPGWASALDWSICQPFRQLLFALHPWQIHQSDRGVLAFVSL